jgi:hypothetical protein
VAYVKKINKCLVKNIFGASEIFFFAQAIENTPPSVPFYSAYSFLARKLAQEYFFTEDP